jgi:predicted transglutaminase-like cysteine proteinase
VLLFSTCPAAELRAASDSDEPFGLTRSLAPESSTT